MAPAQDQLECFLDGLDGVASQSRSRDISDSEDLHHDIARDIGQQAGMPHTLTYAACIVCTQAKPEVEVMILDAKHASETKVGKDSSLVELRVSALLPALWFR